MRRLIINADGLGFSLGVNQGIREVVSAGLVKSTSALANFEAVSEIGDFVKMFPHVSVGIHFNLSVGFPVSPPSQVESLIDPDTGRFWGQELLRRILTGKVSRDHMLRELQNQILRLRELGVDITHFDGHQNKHLYPLFFACSLQAAKAAGIKRIRSHRRALVGSPSQLARYYVGNPQRIASHLIGRALTRYANAKGFESADRLISPGYANESRKFHLQSWLDIIRCLPEGTSEIYCHPAYPDDVLRMNARYVEPRRAEVDVLTSADLKREVAKAGVSLISFYDL